MTFTAGTYGCVDSRSPNLYGRLMEAAIRYFTKSSYSHAFVIISESGDIVEAMPGGARLANISEYAGLNIILYSGEMNDNQRHLVVQAAKRYIGTPYGFLDIVYLGLYLRGINWKWLLGKIRRTSRMICSQLVAQCGVEASVPSWMCGKEFAQLVTPADLAKLAAQVSA